ncbi:MAG TPA: class I SAM-dependent methyltransferase [Thermomicrobiales bacterium]|nr:class I SAM-dependent methyltransferase [Thermomicrobiales bacterium]
MRRNESPQQFPWLLSLPIMRAMQGVYGFLYDEEADLLMAATIRALTMPGASRTVVELGSYCGKSTVVFGLVAKALDPRARVYAVDPHEGVLPMPGKNIQVEPTFVEFTRTLEKTGLEQVVVPITARSTDVAWDKPIDLLFIDALHDYESVAADFRHYAQCVVPRGYVAFHDYGNADFPGVTSAVDEVVAQGGYLLVQRAAEVVVLEKQDTHRRVRGVPLSFPRASSGPRIGPSRMGRAWQSLLAGAGKRHTRTICIEDGGAPCPGGEAPTAET